MLPRKHFLSALLPAAFTLSSVNSWTNTIDLAKHHQLKIPPYLQVGDTNGITCPASYISLEDVQPAVKLMQSWGFKIEVGKTVGKRSFTFGGIDEERLADLQYMLNNTSFTT